jgi:hypothetical protein
MSSRKLPCFRTCSGDRRVRPSVDVNQPDRSRPRLRLDGRNRDAGYFPSGTEAPLGVAAKSTKAYKALLYDGLVCFNAWGGKLPSDKDSGRWLLFTFMLGTE